MVQRSPGLNPPSLTLDDVWVAAAVKAVSWDRILEICPPSPPGFLFILKAVCGVLGDGAWQLQLFTWLASLAQIPLMGYLVRRMTGRLSLGLVAAALVALNPPTAYYGLRVKHFSCDGLIVIIILWLSLSRHRLPQTSAVLRLALVSALVLPVSFTSVFLTLPMVNATVLWTLAAGRRGQRSAGTLLAIGIGFNLVMVAMCLVLFRPTANPSIVEYWSKFYLPINDPVAWKFLLTHGTRLWSNAFPNQLVWLVIFVVGGFWQMLRTRQERMAASALLLFYAGIFTASAMRLYPVGGGRTDLFAYPVAIFTAAVGMSTVGRISRPIPAIAAGVLLTFFVFQAPRPAYPVSGDRAMVELVNETARDGDGLVVYPWANWAMAYYGKWGAWPVKVDDSTNGFYLHLDRENTLVLHETHDAVDFQTGPEVVRAQLHPFLTGGYGRIIYVATDVSERPHQWVVRSIESQGYVPIRTERLGRARFMLFEAASG